MALQPNYETIINPLKKITKIMSNYVHNGKPVFVGSARVRSVSERKNHWVVKTFDPTYNTYRTFYLPKAKVKVQPSVGDYIQTYEVPTKLVGCEINNNPVWHPDVQKADYMY